MTKVYDNFADLITFTRASAGTYVGSDGYIASTAVDVPRIDYDPVTLVVKGLLVEEARTNLVTYSEDFTDASWTKLNSVVTDVTEIGPHGAAGATTLIDDASTGTGVVGVNDGVTIATSSTYTVSAWFKADQLAWGVFRVVGFTTPGNSNAHFDLTNGVKGTIEAG